MHNIQIAREALTNYDLRSSHVDALGNAGGFSGAAIFKVDAADRSFCLKKWPVNTDLQRLAWIHRVLIFTSANGCPELITPLNNNAGGSFTQDSTGIWELTDWARGSANYLQQPNDSKLNRAIDFLARFHQAAARFHFNFSPSQNVKAALDRLNEFDSIVTPAAHSKLMLNYLSTEKLNRFEKQGRGVAAGLVQALSEFKDQPLPVHPVIRDIRAEHLFYEQNELVAVIDFGAMRIDNVACDLSRIIGDTVGNNESKVDSVLEQYNSLRPLQHNERQLAKLFKRASVIVGILNWIKWLILDSRAFGDDESVQQRLKVLISRFDELKKNRA